MPIRKHANRGKDSIEKTAKEKAGPFIVKGHIYAEKGDYGRAILEFSKALDLEPENPVLLKNRGCMFFENELHDEAFEDFNRGLELAEDAQTLYYRGLLFFLRGNYEKALADYARALELDPGFVDVLIGRAEVWIGKGDYDRAFADYDRAISLKPKNADGFKHRGILYHELKKEPDKALADFSAAIRLDPRDAEAWNYRAQCWQERGELKKAEADFKKALALNPGDDEIHWNRAYLYLAEKEYDKCLKDLNRAISINPDSPAYYNSRGIAWFYKRDYTRAVNDLTKALELEGANPGVYINRADCYCEMAAYKEALADYSKAISLLPRNAGKDTDYSVFNKRGLTYFRLGDNDSAIADYTKYIKHNPEDGIAYYRRSAAYSKKGNLRKARDDNARFFSLCPDDTKAVEQRGELYFLEEKFDQAVRCFNKALEKDPRNIPFLKHRGLARIKTGDLEHALEDFNLVLSMEHDMAALAHRGQIFLIQEKPGEALADLSEALAIEPKTPLLIRLHGIARDMMRAVAR
jgi:tetratricopeptide (TPR) repeat protein